MIVSSNRSHSFQYICCILLRTCGYSIPKFPLPPSAPHTTMYVIPPSVTPPNISFHPTRHLIPLNRAFNPTAHLIPPRVSSHRGISSHQASHPTGHLIPTLPQQRVGTLFTNHFRTIQTTDKLQITYFFLTKHTRTPLACYLSIFGLKQKKNYIVYC